MSERNTMAKQHSATSDSPFLRLPGELRNKIYSHVVEDMEGDLVLPFNRTQEQSTVSKVNGKKGSKSRFGTNTSPLLTCKQISEEFLALLFAATHAEVSSEGAVSMIQEFELLTDPARLEANAHRIASSVNGAKAQWKYITHLMLDGSFATTIATAKVHDSEIVSPEWARLTDAVTKMRSSLLNIAVVLIKASEPHGRLDVALGLCQLNTPAENFDLTATWPKVKDVKVESSKQGERYVFFEGEGWINYYSKEMLVSYVPALCGLQT